MKSYFMATIVLCILALCLFASSQNNIVILSAIGSSRSLSWNGSGNANRQGTNSTLTGSGSEARDESTPTYTYDPVSGTYAGGGFDLLQLLNAVKAGTMDGTDAVYYSELLEMYARLEQGQNNNFDVNPSAAMIASLHRNETQWQDFTLGYTGQTVGGRVVSLKNSDKEMVDALSGARGKNNFVWKDANGDGWPDGPFQVLTGTPNDWAECIATDSTKSTFDIYSFRDGMNNVAVRYKDATAALRKHNISLSQTEFDMYAAVQHNRGSQSKQAWGLAYEPANVTVKFGNYMKISAGSQEDLQEQVKMVQTLWNSYLKYNVSYHKSFLTDTAASCTLSWVMLLRNGWLLEDFGTSHPFRSGLQNMYKNFSETPNLNPALVMFPEWTTYEAAVNDITNKYVKPVSTTLGISSGEVDQRYGTLNGKYRDQAVRGNGGDGNNIWYFIYKNEGVTNEAAYNNASTMQMKAYDWVSCGYYVNVGMFGENALITLALKTGTLSNLDGAITDPTNPKEYFKNTSGGYNPVYGNEADTFNEILSSLNIKPNQVQYNGLLEAYKASGDEYSWGEGSGTRWFWGDGSRKLDCSSLSSVYISFGDFKDSGEPRTYYSSGGWKGAVGKSNSQTYSGNQYDTTLSQIDTSGAIMGGRDDSVMLVQNKWGSVLQPGDIVAYNRNGAGHAEIFLGLNNSSDTVKLSAQQTKADKGLAVKPGAPVWISANTFHTKNGIKGGGSSETYAAYRIKAAME